MSPGVCRHSGPQENSAVELFWGRGGGDTTKVSQIGTSLVAQWLGIRLPVQGTRVRALVREDPTCRRATKPVRHNY